MPPLDQITEFSDAPPSGNPWVVAPLPGSIELVDYDPQWPTQARQITDRLAELLQLRALRIDPVGSASVAGLPAKPIIDLDITVADPVNEEACLSQLQEAGFVLTVRQPWWCEHRMLWGGRRSDDRVAPTDGGPAANIHVFGPDSPEPIRHLIFRNWLRFNAEERELYAAAKRAAATSHQKHDVVMDYNARKEAVIRDIYGRAFRAAGFLR